MNLDLGISGTAAPQTNQRVSTAGSSRATPKQKDRPETADEIAVGSGLNDQGLNDIELENMCRLQYARWKDLQEYISGVGNAPDLWPNGLIKSTKKKGDDCKFYWKKTPEWRHMWGKASMMRA